MAKNKRQYGSSNVLIRVYEKSLLSLEYFERILAAENSDDVLQILEETNYDKFIERMEESDFENMLTHALEETFEQVYNVSPNKKVNEYLSLRYTYHNLKLNFKEQITGENLSHLYFDFTPYDFSTIDYAISAGESNRMPEPYVESIREAREAYEQSHDLYAIDVIFDRRFHTHLGILAHEIDDEDLITITKKFTDYRNLIILVRAKNQNRTRNFLNTVLSSSGSIPKEKIMELSDQEISDVVSFYSATHLDKIVAEASNNDDSLISTMELEAIIDDQVMSNMQRGKFIATGPLPIIAYVHAKETEIKNLRIILYAKDLELSEEEIRERMRLNYVT